MVDLPESDPTIFELANAAFRDCADSILEIARRTNTPVIVYRNGKIEHLSPDDFPEHAKSPGVMDDLAETGPNSAAPSRVLPD